MAFLSILPYTIATESRAHLIVACFVVPMSYWWLEVKHRQLVSRATANIVIVAAFVWAAITFFEQNFIYAVGNLLVVVVLARVASDKNVRDFYTVFTVGVVLVCTAAALTTAFFFGVVFSLYLFVAVLALILFTLEREAEGVVRRVDPNERMTTNSPIREIARRRLRSTRGFVLTGAFLWVLVFVGAAVMFVVWPRRRDPFVSRSLSQSVETLTGFSDEIQLTDLKRIIEDRRPVMEVRFTRNGEPFRIPADSIYLRGVSLARWDGSGWSNDQEEADAPAMMEWASQEGRETLIRQEITVEPMDTRVLFALYRPEQARAAEGRQRIQVRRNYGLLASSRRTKPFKYEVLSYVHEPTAEGLRKAPRVPMTPKGQLPELTDELVETFNAPAGRPIADTFDWWSPRGSPAIGDVAECERQYARFVDLYLSTDDVSPAVVELAAQVAPRDTYSSDYEVASAVQRYLEDPQNFSYTLDLSDYAGDDVDPMEHFLFESKAGHCSLFASAMVLMLRAQGVPARIVNGFRGGRWSNMTESYSIQGNYAHSWAEVYFPGHGWVVFDPTPGASIDVSGQRYLANWGEELQGWVRMQWDRYVIAFERQQQEAIYTKLNAAGKRFATAVHAWVNKRSAALAKLSWRNLSVRARIVAGVIALLLAIALWYLVAKLVPVMARKAFGRTRRLAGTDPVPKELRFYPTLLDALAKNGYARRSSVPAMTFAEEVASKNPAVGAPLRDLTALYYRARYGRHAFSRREHHRARDLARETLVASRHTRG